LNKRGIAYLHLGDQLGGHVTEEEASYTLRTTLPRFLDGIERVLDIAGRCRTVLFCAEGEVLDCHRFVVLSRYLAEQRRVEISHILKDGRTETQSETEERLLSKMGRTTDLFQTRAERLAAAYTAKMLRMGLQP